MLPHIIRHPRRTNGTSADSSTDPPGVDPDTDGDGTGTDAPTFYPTSSTDNGTGTDAPTYYPTAVTAAMRAGALNDNDANTNWFQSENEPNTQADARPPITGRKSWSLD